MKEDELEGGEVAPNGKKGSEEDEDKEEETEETKGFDFGERGDWIGIGEETCGEGEDCLSFSRSVAVEERGRLRELVEFDFAI